MERVTPIRHNVRQVKDSLDHLQEVLVDENYSDDSLLRLSRALKEINEEVDMLTTVMQIGRSG
ncbi:hypothetical protein Q4493_09910 [Colwellia sp. 1_MG-2023]|uniref:hypothetical protein n=1 Tax=Colwellia sp. 1_MG-2023 TaxID=3062649 RepID=UPI0026E4699D|nr:hypothetical protein [Colwellia sp. 1_MG-2023]MDO6446088.1 hypothetical protein [Colwellia sp. 1_MG-2023]